MTTTSRARRPAPRRRPGPEPKTGVRSVRFNNPHSMRTRAKYFDCTVCWSAVRHSQLIAHARWHYNAGHLDGYKADSGQCENGGDRLVRLDGLLGEIERT